MAPRYKHAKLKADELLKLGKVKSAPIDVERLATIVQAKLHYEPLENDVSEVGYPHRGWSRAHRS